MNSTLYALRESNNLQPEYLAERLNIDLEAYIRLESGEIRIDIDMAKKLGKVFHIDPELFLATDSKVVNHNTGDHSHSNMVLYPQHYIDTQNGIRDSLFEKILKERDKLKDKLNSLATKK